MKALRDCLAPCHLGMPHVSRRCEMAMVKDDVECSHVFVGRHRPHRQTGRPLPKSSPTQRRGCARWPADSAASVTPALARRRLLPAAASRGPGSLQPSCSAPQDASSARGSPPSRRPAGGACQARRQALEPYHGPPGWLGLPQVPVVPARADHAHVRACSAAEQAAPLGSAMPLPSAQQPPRGTQPELRANLDAATMVGRDLRAHR